MPLFSFFKQRKIQQLGIKGELPGPDDTLAPDKLFSQWFEFAKEAGIALPEATSLATVSAEGQPSSRMVLLKGHDQDGYVFFTNYNSRKAKELLQNPQAAMLFHWTQLQRQVRIEGTIKKISNTESDIYFASRDRLSRQGAHASQQSEPIESRAALEEQLEKIRKKYPLQVPRPENWGGYRLTPLRYEFWQGRSGRIHDRLRFDLTPSAWRTTRLQP